MRCHDKGPGKFKGDILYLLPRKYQAVKHLDLSFFKFGVGVTTETTATIMAITAINIMETMIEEPRLLEKKTGIMMSSMISRKAQEEVD